MAITYCHSCREAVKKCVDIKEEHDYAMKTLHLKCPSCGRDVV